MFLDYKNKLDRDYRNANGIEKDVPISVRKIRDWCSKQEKNLIIYSGIVEFFLDKSDSIVEFDKGFYDSISFNLKKLGYHVGGYSPYFENNINKDILNVSNVFIKDPLVSTVKSWKDIDIEEIKPYKVRNIFIALIYTLIEKKIYQDDELDSLFLEFGVDVDKELYADIRKIYSSVSFEDFEYMDFENIHSSYIKDLVYYYVCEYH